MGSRESVLRIRRSRVPRRTMSFGAKVSFDLGENMRPRSLMSELDTSLQALRVEGQQQEASRSGQWPRPLVWVLEDCCTHPRLLSLLPGSTVAPAALFERH